MKIAAGAAVRGDARRARAHACTDDRDRRRAHPPPGRPLAGRERRAARRRPRAPAPPERQLQDAEHALGQRAHHHQAARELRGARARREPLERRRDDLPRQHASSTRTARCRASGCIFCARRACGRRRGGRSSSTCCSRRSPASSFAAVVSFFVARSIVRPIRRVADATRALAADERHEPLPTERLERARRACARVQPDGRAARRLARGRAELPALGQPRAEDAADRDPRVRRRPRRRRVRRRRGRADDRARSGAAGAARPRPARPGADEPRRVLGRAASRSTSPRSRARRSRRHEVAAREFGVELRAAGDETWVEADHDRLLQVASNLVENALRETPAGGVVTVTRRPGPARRRGHRPRHPGRRRRRTPSSASTSTTRSARTARSAAGSGSRSSSSSRRRWAATSASRAAPARHDLHGLATAAAWRCRPLRSRRRSGSRARVAGRSTSAGSARPRRTRASRCRRGSSRSVFIACATMRACGGSC